ncbi:NAD(P)/FAD-dependent oxidoreductase [Desulfosarcina ovata]|uniref:NAD-utilizing dehydrogenase n=1 Tax=Desulfosarcina ovata subsp. ovata TaxID=2752305 RepID=A0A5K8A5E9_9BACT|nr:FAD-dependent oxidoreductase [Desulfosarcina ovata]BBO87802.1 NAD-utilizing dehydrogenase [Desulfosarcina ovata subsp. ovata]
MPEAITLVLSPAEAADLDTIRRSARRKLGHPVAADRIVFTRRSIDARKRPIRVNLGLSVYDDNEPMDAQCPVFQYRNVATAEPVLIVGAGPAGLFAALRLLELGLKPVVVERGKPVGPRRRDVAALNRRGILDSDSNYAFGEGGAGTFSDGKLYTRSKKRGDHKRVLQRFYQHGADAAILYEAHAHIGSNRLPGIVQAMRETILRHGGEIHFQQAVVGLTIIGGRIAGAVLRDGGRLAARAVILATGHSARDVYGMLLRQGIALEAKAFAMGVRVEHPQELIDRIQYHGQPRGDHLPAAAYRLVQQVDGRGVYSFCMCPGGFIVPASTEPDRLVVNGMSFAKRNSPFANAGIVVEITLDDIPGLTSGGPLAGLDYQETLERLAFQNGGGGVVAPAQRLADFVAGRPSSTLPKCSYPPGVTASPLSAWLPAPIGRRLQAGFKAFDRRLKGFLTNDAVVVGVESRTSSPVRIPRHPQTLQHIDLDGLFPCGEGAGYAGGIVSCAVDGERAAEAVVSYLI